MAGGTGSRDGAGVSMAIGGVGQVGANLNVIDAATGEGHPGWGHRIGRRAFIKAVMAEIRGR